MKRKLFVTMSTCLVFLITSFAGKAQERQLQLDINYSVGIPSGAFKTDAVDETSFRGWTANLMYNITPKISVGLGTGFQDFYQKYPRAVYKLEEGGEISAVLTNSIQTVPILAQVQYRFMPGRMVQPYVSAGVGGNMVMYDQYLGEFSNSNSTFKFAARPMVGLFIPFRKNGPAGINVYGAYNYMPYNRDNIENLHNWSTGIGIKFPLR